MTQEKDSAPTRAKKAPKAKENAQAKKPRATAKKSPAKTAETTATATTATKSAVKKPRVATPKAATEKAAPKAAAKPTAAKKTTKAAAEAAAETPKTPVKAKAPAKPRATAKTAAKAEPAKTAAAKTAAKKTAEPAASPEPEQKKPRATRQAKPKSTGAKAASAKSTAKGAVKKDAAPESAAPVTPAPADPAPVAPASETGQTAGERPEGSHEHKPSSRRSRRGGRRRNKNRTANANGAPTDGVPAEGVLTDGAAQTAAVQAEHAETDSPEAPKGAKSGGRGRGRGKKSENNAESAGEQKPAADDEKDSPKTASNKRKMFISVLSGELVEVVLAEEGHIAEYYVEMQHQAKVKGNIYKGVVSNIDANLQAAFISYAGGVKNGFLQIDEVHPEYYLAHHEPGKGRKFPPIQKVLKAGQEILVQVVKEPAGTKGAFLTSYLSLPGRFLVLTPGREQIGVSRKVDSDEERVRLRAMLEGLTPGKGLGVIVRTVSEGASKTNLQRDLQFLKRLWKEVRTKGQTAPTPSLIYQELDLATRAVRDYLTDDVQEVWTDDAETAKQVTELATLLFPKKKNLIQVHQENGSTLFERFNLQRQLDQIHSREVTLPSGGRLVIDNTEALTAIDINSGRSSGKSNFEDMAYRTNIEAARAIPLQLRLRDIGGQVVVDFIEMRDRNHWKEVEKAVRNGMKGDRARFDVGKIGPFGLLEIVRQRLGSSAISISTEPCPCCKGTGIRRNLEWQSMRALRDISKLLRQAAANNQPSMTYETESELAFYLLNAKRTMLQSLETEAGVAVVIRPAG